MNLVIGKSGHTIASANARTASLAQRFRTGDLTVEKVRESMPSHVPQSESISEEVASQTTGFRTSE